MPLARALRAAICDAPPATCSRKTAFNTKSVWRQQQISYKLLTRAHWLRLILTLCFPCTQAPAWVRSAGSSASSSETTGAACGSRAAEQVGAQAGAWAPGFTRTYSSYPSSRLGTLLRTEALLPHASPETTGAACGSRAAEEAGAQAGAWAPGFTRTYSSYPSSRLGTLRSHGSSASSRLSENDGRGVWQQSC